MAQSITLKTNERSLTFEAGDPVKQTVAEKRGAPRTGSWSEFTRRFDPLDIPEGGTHDFCNDVMWETGAGLECDPAHVWTVIDGDNGELYVVEGWCFVNRLGYIIAKNPRLVDSPARRPYKAFKY